MICPSYADPSFLIFSDQVPALLYYSHMPAIVVALFIGFFVFLKNNHLLLSKLLISISITFSVWVFLDLIVWTNNNSELIMFVWSFFGILYAILSILCLYFVLVFVDKRDITFRMKLFFGALFIPVAIFASTAKNINDFMLTLCGVVNEGIYYGNYYYGIGFLMFFWILLFLILRYLKAEREFRRQIILLGLGVELFLLSFFTTGYIAGILTENSYNIEFYGLLGMTFFMGVLAYLIVEYKAFNIKMLGVQALVAALVILIGSQFFFVHDKISIILTGITLALSLVFGYRIIKSVKNEITQKEILETANKEISERKEQLQVMADSLAIANDKLRKLDNAKTEFISIASHQLRTPVTAIKGFVSLILEGSYGEIGTETKSALEKVYLSSERLVALIEDLLNVSRIESGRMTFEFEKASVEKLLKELYDNFILIAKKKNFYLDLKLPTQALPEITMDQAKVRELVSNFIDNALKYTEKGGVTIKAEIISEGVIVDENGFVIPRRNSGFGKVIRVTISDTGIGIGRDEIPYLFRKFSRGKDVSRLHVSGTGLGLYVGKAIATAHHGQTWVESDGVGMGSRFMIEIPVEGV